MFSTIRTRILLVITLILLFSLAINTGINFYVSKNETQKSVRTTLVSLAESHASAVEEWVENKKEHLLSLVPYIDDPAAVTLLTQGARAGKFMHIDIVMADNRVVSSDPSGIPAGYDPTTRPWYRQARAAGTVIMTNPYHDITTGQLTVTVAAPRSEQGELRGMVQGDIDIADVIENVRAIHPTPTSFGMMIDADGTIIAHPRDALTLKPLSSIIENLNLPQLLSATSPLEVMLDNHMKYMVAKPVAGTSWYIVVLMNKAEAYESMQSLLRLAALSLVVLMIISAVIVNIIIRRSLTPLEDIRASMDAIAEGDKDLTRRLEVSGNNEVSHIASAFNRFADQLTGVMHSIRASSQSVRTAADEIAAGTRDLSNRTEESAANLQQTSSALEQISATVASSACAAQEANAAVLVASDVAQRGGRSINGVVETMKKIEEASAQIGNIISVIDSIAFQTNILALNASVEAARAGDQGRGFAVVANEVRNLASRSADAAKEIRELIDTTVTCVNAGAKQVRESGDTMQELVRSVRSVTAIMSQINQTAAEQTQGIREINQAVAELDSMVQQNAALVEQSSSASAALQGQAQELAAVVNQYRL